MNTLILCMLFCISFYFSIMEFVRLIHVVARALICSFYITSFYSIVFTYHNVFILFNIERHLSYLTFFLLKTILLWALLCVFWYTYLVSWYTFCIYADSHGRRHQMYVSSVILNTAKLSFQKDCYFLSPWQCIRVPVLCILSSTWYQTFKFLPIRYVCNVFLCFVNLYFPDY